MYASSPKLMLHDIISWMHSQEDGGTGKYLEDHPS